MAQKWVNGTVLHYAFRDGPEPQCQAVRSAFQEWKDLGIGLEFREVDEPGEAEVRISFDQADGSWSYVGRDVLTIGTQNATMNFGWDLTDEYGRTTALHEIGHTMGLPHEHQNPFAGIVWDETRVYEFFAGAPNHWPPETTHHNVLRKLGDDEVEGSTWDPDSVMQYSFPEGLIKEPARYQPGISPPGGLSAKDQEWVRKFYPVLPDALPALEPFRSTPLTLAPGQQADFAITPDASRKYQVATFGAADTTLVLFEEVDGELRFLAGDDDSGEDRNSSLSAKLFRGRRYVVRVRLAWAGRSGDTAIMCW
ncbi:M12 family metallopeptidase [uncultured Kocuria sp.]|uniref:M12 family metallopeptidase n=1 Tax=uncultured Kocuria sp. TaxID=259305 RepID=UPI00262E5345|nr:M12 family metallopeptidase [uncultured Kocuria sp.]